ncbi:MAG: hypothetical protein R3230_01225 [Nitrosopumilaceae archaeon]|nr:hypothetical protein [Nitrosopumilaceae archaeon]
MYQETGETRDAILEDDARQIQKIVDANKNRTDPYWIVMFVKPSKISVDGKLTLTKVIKPYASRPSSQVGMIIGEVDNKKGSIDWEVNQPQAPFNFNALSGLGAKQGEEVVVETTSIPNAYITQ